MPQQLGIDPAYPNPVKIGESINIVFHLHEPSKVKLAVVNDDYDTLRVLCNDSHSAGCYLIIWDLKDKRNWLMLKGVYRCLFFVNDEQVSYGDIWIK